MWIRFLGWVMSRRPTKAYELPEGQGSGILFYRSHLFNVGRQWVVYLHHYVQGDPDRGLHDHPGRAIAIPLSGGYKEHRLAGFTSLGVVTHVRKRRLFLPYYINEHCLHRVEIQRGRDSWSLFLAYYVPGKSWGFIRDVSDPQQDEGRPLFRYTIQAPGLEEDVSPWWQTAPAGKFVIKEGDR